MNSKKTHELIGLGPAVPKVPRSTLSKLPCNLSDAWSIVGPTIQANNNRPIWELLSIAYLQGVMHGAQI